MRAVVCPSSLLLLGSIVRLAIDLCSLSDEDTINGVTEAAGSAGVDAVAGMDEEVIGVDAGGAGVDAGDA